MQALRLLGLAIATIVAGAAFAARPAIAPLPKRLSETGLFINGSTRVHADAVAFSPQYPLWSDGTRKRRWIRLPRGTAIDASQIDAWQFPVGTKLWKEFATDRPIETRMIERLADGTWRFATYVWNPEGTDATLAPEDGAQLSVSSAPAGRYAVPSRADCLACHEGAAVPVLGFTALQLSADRDPLAPHADAARSDMPDLRSLAARGWLRDLPAAALASPPRIAGRSALERTALGYLHGNCGHCHNAAGALTGLEFVLAQHADPAARSAEQVVQSLVGHSSRFRPHGSVAAQRVASDGHSVLTLRMKSDNPMVRMPPLGVQVIDTEGVALVERWIATDLKD